MRKLATALILVVFAAAAMAACPPEAPYGCKTELNGKQRCGCGV